MIVTTLNITTMLILMILTLNLNLDMGSLGAYIALKMKGGVRLRKGPHNTPTLYHNITNGTMATIKSHAIISRTS